MRGMILAVLALLAATPAAAQPAAVAQATQSAMQDCRGAGGTPSLQPGYQTGADLNGDGVEDYLLDFQHLECANAWSFFCGSAGCPLVAFVSGPSGHRAQPFGHVQGWSLIPGSPPAVEVALHGAMCRHGGIGAEGCTRRYAWNGRELAALGAASRPQAAPPEAAPAPSATARPPAPPSPSDWSLRPVAGRSPVATVAGPGVIHSVSLLCFNEVPVVALALRGRPSVSRATVTFLFPSLGRLDHPIGQQPGGGQNVWYADLSRSRLPQLLAGRDSQAVVAINGVRQGTISLRGSTASIRSALQSCYRF
ncbi:hypothetical protein [Elioraea sp.]|uniref:hypothetical protein n=1 Tax=Elioraea sp. TaxID=2185103 RepID=UPI0021DD5A2F|nr:hypothetical protein [Elioraea sp.]GIX10295.1 MAG: hypothetical protein KatS3mg116_2005 [Elioraea sp.]